MKKKKEKKMGKTNRITKWILVIIIIIMIGLLVSLIHDKTKNPPPTKKRAKELVYNSYVYYELSSGNVPLSDDKLFLDDQEFFGMDIKVHSLKEIENILKDSFSEQIYSSILIDVYGDKDKLFSDDQNVVFINKATTDENCKDLKLSKDIKIIKDHGNYYIKYTSHEDGIYVSQMKVVYENGKWVLEHPIKVCFSKVKEQKSE